MSDDGASLQWLVHLEGFPHIKPKKPIERKIFFHDEYVIDETGTKKTHEDLGKDQQFLKGIIKKLTENSYFFHGLEEGVIMKSIARWIISIVEIKPWIEIISEHDEICGVFYLLLNWKLGIYIKHGKRKVKICDVKKMKVIGEIGFINPKKRTATVITEERSFLMRFDKRFIDNLSMEDQIKIKDNLIMELSSKVVDLNFILAETCDKMSWWNGGSTIVTEEIKKQIENMICHSIEKPHHIHKVKKEAN